MALLSEFPIAGPAGPAGPVGPMGPVGPVGPVGPSGDGSGDMVAAVYDPTGQRKDIFNPYNIGASTRPTLLINGLFMIDQRSNGPYQNKYGPDGWITFEKATATFDNPGVTLTPGEASNGGMNQFLESIDSGMFTLSALFDNGDICWAVYAVRGNGQSIEQRYMHKGNTIGAFTLGYAANTAKNYVQFRINKQTKFLGAKLEPGESQTLAYKDSDGNWKLLPQPGMDLGTQLLRCQRYFQLYSSADARPNSPIDCRPVMRMPAGGQLTQGTIMIDGVTYYYNSAEL